MEQLYVFGTGHAAVTRCYNTCFAIEHDGEFFMTDAGGGNGILRILEDMKVDMTHIHHIFVTHGHTDHILGIVWMVRFIGTKILNGVYEGKLCLYSHKDLLPAIETLCRLTLPENICRVIGSSILLIPVSEGEKRTILGMEVTFFSIHSTKAEQYGFTAILSNGKKLTCCGDEPFHPLCAPYAENSAWLLHEAFCLYQDRDRFKPYEKHHSTARDAAAAARDMNAQNIILWHTEDTDLEHRKERYSSEAANLFHGGIFVPRDGEIIDLALTGKEKNCNPVHLPLY